MYKSCIINTIKFISYHHGYLLFFDFMNELILLSAG